GDPSDEKHIREAALRLVAGQNPDGGWRYNCPPLTEKDQADLMTMLEQTRPRDPAELFAPIGNAPGGVGPDGKPIGGPGVGPAGRPGGAGGAGGKPPAPPRPGQRPAGGAKAPKPDRLAPNLRNIPALQEKLEVEHRGITSDNSNTQFAVLALWAAQRHGVPME